MEGAAKMNNKNASPLPQRQQRGSPANKNLGKHASPNHNAAIDGYPAEKKAKYGSNNQNGGGVGGAGGAGGGGGARGGFAGNRNRGGQQNQNRQGFQGSNNAIQKQANESPKPAASNAASKNIEPAVSSTNQTKQNANQGQGNQRGQGNQGNQGGQGFRGRGGQNQNQNANQGNQADKGGLGNQGGREGQIQQNLSANQGNQAENGSHGNQGDQGNHGGQGNQGGQGPRGRGGGQNQPNQNQQGGNQGGQGYRGRGGGGSGGGGSGSGGGGNQNQRGNRGNRSGGQGGINNSIMGGGGQRGEDFFITQRLRGIGGPTLELPNIEVSSEDTKFSGRNRLYVGNLTGDITDDELREMFKPYGEISEIFSNLDKNFTFLKVDYHQNAEKAKRALDGTIRKGRQIRVRFAPNATILRVSNLNQFVSNELLYHSFEIFGPIERAIITVDDRGKHTGEGIVEFVRKSSASACLRFCNEKCFFLTASLRPCLVEPMDLPGDSDGLPEKALKKVPEFSQERNIGPRFAERNSFEHEYGSRWKHLHGLFKSKQDALKRELKMEEDKLEAQMEYARYEQETELLRQELRKREVDNERKKMEWEMREKHAEEMRQREEETMRRRQSEMQTHMFRQEEDMRMHQQENAMLLQAQQLNSLLDQQEGFGVSSNTGFDNFESPFEVFRNNNNSNNSPRAGNNSGTVGQDNSDSFDFAAGGNQRGNNAGGNPSPWGRRRF